MVATAETAMEDVATVYNMYKTTLKIDGMMCGMCEAHIADVIRKTVENPKKVSASHKKGEASFLSESVPDADELKCAIAATGYECKAISSAPYEKKGFLGLW